MYSICHWLAKECTSHREKDWKALHRGDNAIYNDISSSGPELLDVQSGKPGGHLTDPQFRPGCCWEPPTDHGGKLFSPVTHGLMCYKFCFSPPCFLNYGNVKSQTYPVF